MKLLVETNRLHEIVFIDGRRSASGQWAEVEAELGRRHPSDPWQAVGAYVISEDCNSRRFFQYGEKLRG